MSIYISVRTGLLELSLCGLTGIKGNEDIRVNPEKTIATLNAVSKAITKALSTELGSCPEPVPGGPRPCINPRNSMGKFAVSTLLKTAPRIATPKTAPTL
ncbi:7431_t:CDS:1 [Racocetra fulgida]|uniref:7431_t:CDS:1 n=1 Tax=Racocetra fulgida TaxID=60492 RepID=A0A9N9FSP7_9GLOM|nr:7431_t:CDS:1 [Racocetra fulgida]